MAGEVNELDAVGGQASALAAALEAAAMARFDSMASDPPRRMVALPLLKQSAAASLVTLGRDS